MADVQATLEKWAKNTSGAVQSYKNGVLGVTESPMEKAALAADRYAAGAAKAVEEGRFQAGLRAVSTSDWQTACTEKGAQRIAGGVTAAKPRMGEFLSQLLPKTDEVKRAIAKMPRGTLEDSKQRALAAIDMMSKFKFIRRRS